MTTDKNLKKNRMFRNPLLELLSWSHPGLMIPFHLIIISLLIASGRTLHPETGYGTITAVFVAGFFSWTLAEYLMHRYVFHWIKEDSKIVSGFHYALHGYHHSHPNDANRLFMPPVPALLFLSAFFGIFGLFLGSYVWYFLPGFELGYLIYSYVHYSMHTQKAPKRLKFLWKHHTLHHFKYPDKAFGVSSRFWDRVFGTMPPEQEKQGHVTVKAP